MFLSKIERANEELRRAAAQRAREGITPQHSAAVAGLAGDDSEHQADAGLTKAYKDAVCPPASFPLPSRVAAEDLRRGPIREGRDALSPGFQPPLQFPVQPAGHLLHPPGAGSYVTGDCL